MHSLITNLELTGKEKYSGKGIMWEEERCLQQEALFQSSELLELALNLKLTRELICDETESESLYF